jgi:hypothetical protein
MPTAYLPRKRTKYVVLVKEGRKWVPCGDQLFNSEDDAWYWVDTNFRGDDERLRFYLAPVDMTGFPR